MARNGAGYAFEVFSVVVLFWPFPAAQDKLLRDILEN